MKRAVRVLVWLYPPSWRKRYGAEFEALLEDATPSVLDGFDIVLGALKMRMTTGVFTKITLAGLAVGIAVATLVFVASPKHYRSEALFTVTPSNTVTPSSQFTAHVLDALQRKAFFNNEFLTSLIQDRNLYPNERSRMPMYAVIDEMKSNIRVYFMPTVPPGKKAEVKFVVQFEYSDRKVAQEVNEELVFQFMRGIVDLALVDPHPGTNFQILNPPTLPLRPFEPNLARSSAIGLLGGLLTGLALTILAKLHWPGVATARRWYGDIKTVAHLMGAARERVFHDDAIRAPDDLPFPSDVDGTERYLEIVSRRLIHAIAKHEFANARYYHQQDRKARALLAELRAKPS